MSSYCNIAIESIEPPNRIKPKSLLFNIELAIVFGIVIARILMAHKTPEVIVPGKLFNLT